MHDHKNDPRPRDPAPPLDVPTFSDGSGWASTRPPRRHPSRRRMLSALFLIPVVLGLIGAPDATPPVQGDELSDVKAALAKQKNAVAEQGKEVSQLNARQRGLASDIANARKQLAGINADLTVVRKRITRMSDRIDVVKGKYQGLVNDLAKMDRQLLFLTS